MYLVLIEFLGQLSFGSKLYPYYQFLLKNPQYVGYVGFAYGLVLFYGTVCATKFIPKDFNDFVFSESAKIIRRDSEISIDDLSKEIYDKWVENIPNLPGRYFIPSKKGFWITKPTASALEEDLKITRQSVISLLQKDNTQAK